MTEWKQVAWRCVARRGIRVAGWMIAVCLTAWILRATVVSVYRVSSVSMEPTLKEGEYVVVSRASYGIRTPDAYPLSSIPFPSGSLSWGGPERGDLVVFKSPMKVYRDVHPSRVPTYVKRCVARPGDTVRLADRRLVVSGPDLSSEEEPRDVRRFAYALHQTRRGRAEKTWIVPARGDTVDLGTASAEQWLRVLRHDGHRASVSEKGIRIDGEPQRHYVVEQEYYFMLGDNPLLSRDSRHWGVVPEQNLVGEVWTIAWPPHLDAQFRRRPQSPRN